MEKTRCNIELETKLEAKDMYRPHNGETQNDKRVPTKKGISLPLHRWKLLASNMDFVDQALYEKRDYKTHLARNVYATVKASGIYVDIRQH